MRGDARRDGCHPKGLDRGAPVWAVVGPRRVECGAARSSWPAGTRLPAKKLTPARLRTRVREAMTMTEGARRVAAGFAATGGVGRGADLIEQRIFGSSSGSPRAGRFGYEAAAQRRGTVDMGVATRVNGAAPPFVPLEEIDLASWDFRAQDNDFRDGAFASLRREAPIRSTRS